MGEDDRLLPALRLNANSIEAFSKLEKHFNDNNYSFCCRRFRLIDHARNIRIEEGWVYTAYLCTLNEERSPSTKTSPYKENETCLNSPLGDIWKDYEFDLPVKTELDGRELCRDEDLYKTRRKEGCPKCKRTGQIQCKECLGNGYLNCLKCNGEGTITCCTDDTCQRCTGQGSYPCMKCSGQGTFECSGCHNQGQIHCSHCKGCGSIVSWTKLNVKWFNRSSTIFYSTRNLNLHLQNMITTARNKVKCLEFDDILPSTAQSLDDILNRFDDLPEGFQNEIKNKFLEHKKADRILRVKCTIERIYIKRFDYQLNGLSNEIFTFYLYGETQRVYADQSSYPSYTQQYQRTCSLM